MNRIKIYFNGFVEFLTILFQRKGLIYEMVKQDIFAKYLGSLLGILWAFINPLVTIFIFWLIFSVGFKTAPKGNVPFVIWLTAGMAIWNTFAEAISSSTSIFLENTHLVKKILFPLSILPVIKLISSFVTHVIFLLLLVVLILLHGMPFNLYWLQSFYYLFAMCCLALGISWLTSSINVFARDTSQVVTVILQFGFWGTPIFWNLGIMPENMQFIFKLNPMFYLVQGYRDSFIYFVPFWHHWQMTIYYWSFTSLVMILGSIVFLRMRKHFADVI